VRYTSMVASLLITLASVAWHPAHGQSVPDLGPNGSVSSVQATGCVPPSPANDKFDYCGWGVWSIETQRSTMIATLADPASYLVCREQVDPVEANGYPIVAEVDGVAVTSGTPPAAMGQSPTGCFIVSGKRIVLSGSAKPSKPVRGYYIRLGPKIFGNTVSWVMRKGGGSAGTDRILIAKGPQQRVFRVCFGNYTSLLNAPPYLREYKLWVDTDYAPLRGTEHAIFNFGSCVDAAGGTVGIEPRWVATEPAAAFGRFSF
jgi:hypothetical protein